MLDRIAQPIVPCPRSYKRRKIGQQSTRLNLLLIMHSMVASTRALMVGIGQDGGTV